MRPIAERLVLRPAAPAQRDAGAAAEVVRRSLRIDQLEVAFDPNGSVGIDGDFGCWHGRPVKKR
jgi:hypothetical protein